MHGSNGTRRPPETVRKPQSRDEASKAQVAARKKFLRAHPPSPEALAAVEREIHCPPEAPDHGRRDPFQGVSAIAAKRIGQVVKLIDRLALDAAELESLRATLARREAREVESAGNTLEGVRRERKTREAERKAAPGVRRGRT